MPENGYAESDRSQGGTLPNVAPRMWNRSRVRGGAAPNVHPREPPPVPDPKSRPSASISPARRSLSPFSMHWPSTPVECLPPSAFTPPFCPWPACPQHRPPPHTPPRFHRHGHYPRACDPRRPVPRFRCLACRRTCSRQSFSTSYYLKRPDLSVPIAAGLVAGSAHRQLARSLACSPPTVMRRAARLGRHALLLLARAHRHLPPLHEPIVYDDFETFAYAQDFPFGLGTAVGHHSWFVYSLDQAPHRRAPRPSAGQKARRLGRKTPPGAYIRAFRRLLDLLVGLRPDAAPITLLTDDHPAYRTALSRHTARDRIDHHPHPNPRRRPKGVPRSPEARRRDRAMFPVDLLHKLLRHSCAHHRRETIAFGRRLEGLLERAFLVAVWRNWVKRRSERRPREATPAMQLGLAREPWAWHRVLARRLFVSRLEVPEPWMAVYRRALAWPVPEWNRPHELKNAF
jgi:transposase-like protein